MTLIENGVEQSKNVYKKDTQVRLVIVGLMNEKTTLKRRTYRAEFLYLFLYYKERHK